jgi:hypothetical protein
MPENGQNYTEMLSIRITAAQKKAFDQKAQQAQKPTGEWARDILDSTSSFQSDYRALLAEFLAMRRIVLHLYYNSLNDTANEQAVRELVQLTEAEKFRLADEQISKYLQQ